MILTILLAYILLFLSVVIANFNPASPTILQIGFPKCGTTSLNELLKKLGFNPIHWRIYNNEGPPIFVSHLIQRALNESKPMLSYVKGSHVLAEMNGDGIWPQLNYQQLYHEYPDALFILNTRDVDAHFVSLYQHDRYDLIFDDELVPKSFPGNSVEARVKGFLLWHSENVRHFFRDKIEANFVEFNIDVDTVSKFKPYFDTKGFELPVANAVNLVLRITPLEEKKVFVLGFPGSGVDKFTNYFKEKKLSICSSVINGTALPNIMANALKRGVPMLTDIYPPCNVVLDMNSANHSIHINHFRQLYLDYKGAYFILNTGDPDFIYKSMSSELKQYYGHLSRHLPGKDEAGRVNSLIEKHYENVRSFFAKESVPNFLDVNVDGASDIEALFSSIPAVVLRNKMLRERSLWYRLFGWLFY